MQYHTNVTWDATLTAVWTLQSDANTRAPAVAIAGLVSSAVKMTTGAPTATVGKFIPGAMIQNAISGVIYFNTGTTASPVFTALTLP